MKNMLLSIKELLTDVFTKKIDVINPLAAPCLCFVAIMLYGVYFHFKNGEVFSAIGCFCFAFVMYGLQALFSDPE